MTTLNPTRPAQGDSRIVTEGLSQVRVYSDSWRSRTAFELSRLQHLPEGWDSYGSPPPSVAAVVKALNVLEAVGECGFGRFLSDPDSYPTAGGGVGQTWKVGNRRLELEVLPDGETIEYLTTEQHEAIEEGCVGSHTIFVALFEWLLGE